MYGIEIPKQRGIYSEILTTEDTENLKVSSHPLNLLVLTNIFIACRKYQPLDLEMPLSARSTRSSRSLEPKVSFRTQI